MTQTINKVIEKLLKEKEIKNLIKKASNSEHKIDIASSLVGEVYTYCIACNDGKDISKQEVLDYLKQIISNETKKSGTNNDFLREKTLISAIYKRLGIDEKTVTNEQKEQVKNYFFKNYVQEGYVMHAFPAACRQSIEKHGFSSSVRIWDSEEILSVADMFAKQGVLLSVGGYSRYKGGGMYVEHDPRKVLWHSLSAPEWFRVFTSSNHAKVGSDIKEAPYIMRNYRACKKNVLDMCRNAGLQKEEAQQVLAMFEKNWKILKNPELPVAMIPRREIGKDKVQEEYKKMDVIYAISAMLNDWANEYQEHKGNSLSQTITRDQMLITTMPSAASFLTEEKYKTESKEELFDPASIFNLIKNGLKGGFTISYSEYRTLIDKMKETYQNDSEKLELIEKFSEEVAEIEGFPSVKKVDSLLIVEEKHNNPNDFPDDMEIVIEDIKKEEEAISDQFKQ